jgi:hypothetical protein
MQRSSPAASHTWVSFIRPAPPKAPSVSGVSHGEPIVGYLPQPAGNARCVKCPQSVTPSSCCLSLLCFYLLVLYLPQSFNSLLAIHIISYLLHPRPPIAPRIRFFTSLVDAAKKFPALLQDPSVLAIVLPTTTTSFHISKALIDSLPCF